MTTAPLIVFGVWIVLAVLAGWVIAQCIGSMNETEE